MGVTAGAPLQAPFPHSGNPHGLEGKLTSSRDTGGKARIWPKAVVMCVFSDGIAILACIFLSVSADVRMFPAT